MFQTDKTETSTERLDEQESLTTQSAHARPAPHTQSVPHQQADGAGGENDLFPLSVALKEFYRTSILPLVEAHDLKSIALLRRVDQTFVASYATGRFESLQLRIPVDAQDQRLLEAATQGQPLRVNNEEVKDEGEAAAMLFPLVVGDETKGAILIGNPPLEEAVRLGVAEYCREIALPLEVLWLREELERDRLVALHLQNLTVRLNAAGPQEAYTTILRHSAELLHAERVSLLMFDQSSNQLAVKAAFGPHTEAARAARMELGDGIAGTVLREGRPLVVSDMKVNGHRLASPERRYKTNSFISYPLTAGGRQIGVLNATDKLDGSSYGERDVRLLDMFAPQIMLALDLAEWHERAAEYQLLAITDPITGLLNRRYLEERISEELKRSKRHKYEMSFIMIDIDHFKLYNDRNGHQAGDVALGLTAECLKTALRSEDSAVRYGGEEFSVLLPQTSLDEAQVIAERIRRCVEATNYPHGDMQPYGAVTISIGISTFNETLDTSAKIIGAADYALYQAKSLGKNRISLSTTPAPSPS